MVSCSKDGGNTVDPNNNPNQPNHDDEKIREMIRELKKRQLKKKPPLGLVFMLHSNFIVHMTLSFLVNVLSAAVIIGFSEAINAPLLSFQILGFLIAMGLLALAENFIKILMYRYFPKLMLMSLGMVALMIQVIILYLIDRMLPVGFEFLTAEYILVFAFVFSGLRLIISVYVRKWFRQTPLVIIRRRLP